MLAINNNASEQADSTFLERMVYSITFYAITLLPRVFFERPWWSTIVPGLKVGAIPIAEFGHRDRLTDECVKDGLDLGLVVSCCEPFALAGQGLVVLSPVCKNDWLEKNVQQLHFNMTDFGVGVTESMMDKTIDRMNDIIKAGQTVYVHCKAGRGRSVTTAACYLIKYENYQPQDAIEYIREIRNEISLSQTQLDFIDSYSQYINERYRAIVPFEESKQMLYNFDKAKEENTASLDCLTHRINQLRLSK